MVGGGWVGGVNLVIDFGPNLGLALCPRAKPINKECFKVEYFGQYLVNICHALYCISGFLFLFIL